MQWHRLTLVAWIAIIKIPEPHAIIVLSIDGAVVALASIATTRVVFNVRVYVSSVTGYSSYWPSNNPPLQFEMGPREQLGTFSTDPSSTTA